MNITGFLFSIVGAYILSRIYAQYSFHKNLADKVLEYCVLKYEEISSNYAKHILPGMTKEQLNKMSIDDLAKDQQKFIRERNDLFSYDLIYYKVTGFTPHFSNQVLFFFLRVLFDWNSSRYILDRQYYDDLLLYNKQNQERMTDLLRAVMTSLR